MRSIVSALPAAALCARVTGDTAISAEKQEISEIVRSTPRERMLSSSKIAQFYPVCGPSEMGDYGEGALYYCSLAYSALACLKMGISRSASFHWVRKSW